MTPAPVARGESGIRWVGCGRTAFAIPVAAGATGAVRQCEDASGVAAALGPGWDSPRARAVREYFAAGGRPCLVTCDDRLYDSDWIGDDLGPGMGSGVHALVDREDVGTVVLLAPEALAPTSRREELIVDAAATHPDVLFLVEAAGEPSRPAQPVYALRPNVVLVAPELVGIGALAGHLEASDWRPATEYRRRRLRPPPGTEESDLAEVHRWRRRAGLRRAVDAGTRWMLFEPSHPLLWRSVERDVKAFLRRLERWGFFESGEPLPSVRCEPAAAGPDHADAAHVVLRVDPPSLAVKEG